ncbi:MAG TPA: alpha/beta fold hydrolase [Longimicrobiales bacterium]
MTLEPRSTPVGRFRLHSVHTGAGPPAVLLHGLAGSHRWWRTTIPALARTHRVHVPELIGFARNPAAGPLPDIARTAELIVEWLDALGIERPHLVGHSMGGQIAIHLAARQPDRVARLVLVDAAGIPRQRPLAELVRLLAELIPPPAWGRPSFLPTIARDALRMGPLALAAAARRLLADDVRPLLPTIRSPTLLIWGRLDPLTPLDHAWTLADGIPDARLCIIPDAAHNPMVDRPEAFNEILTSFLAGS